MSAPVVIAQLIQKFTDSREHFRSNHYNEAQLRREFLDPFFEALGWDVGNQAGYAPQYREVIVEDSLRIEDSAKAPDYAFLIGPQRKFFVEAKKPAVDIKDDIHPAYQLRRYAWNAHLSLSILTDFEELAVYDCRNKPNPGDKAATGRLLLFKYTEYETRWDELAAIFSREAVWKGSFDRYAQEASPKKGTTEVDSEFLKDIETWRDLLARNIALRNLHARSERLLNYAVQMIIDRIIFLRISEDRGLQPQGQLQELANAKSMDGDPLPTEANPRNQVVYPRLLNLFRYADQKYNSGLFHFQAESNSSSVDAFTPTLTIDDKVLREIIRGLYFPSPYIFKEIPVEILGQVYEQFLGKVIRLTPGGQARVDTKPEVRKAGGVYYTPRYIVDYIVENTVGRLLERLSPSQASKLRIVDPACGSGSFLLGAYQFLLDWHLKWYLTNDPEIYTRGRDPTLTPATGGTFRLTTTERKRILVNNIYGVDIDAQAVEVTKLSLLLKLLEEETGQLSLGFERVLPDLGQNIQCGNSLIDWDYFTGQLIPDQDEVDRVNPFDWRRAFPHVFAQGGFDTVIGNPPYIRIQSIREWAPKDVDHYKRIYPSACKGNFDIYVLFVERGLSLLNTDGRLGFILPHKFFQADFARPIREIITSGTHIHKIVHFGAEQVFSNATTYTCLLFLNNKSQSQFVYTAVSSLHSIVAVFESMTKGLPHEDYQTAVLPAPKVGSNEWHFFASKAGLVLEKLRQQPKTLADVTEKIFVGLQTSADKIYVLQHIEDKTDTVLCYSNSLEKEVEIEKGLVKPFLMGKDVHRYEPLDPKNCVIFPYMIGEKKALLMDQLYIKTHFPKGWEYLVQNRRELGNRENGKMVGNQFYAYIYPKNLSEFESTKILTPEISLGCNMTIDQEGVYYHTTKVYSFLFKKTQQEHPYYWLGLLNSKLLWFFVKSTGYTLRGGYFTFKTNYLNPFPVVTIDFSDPKMVRKHDYMVELVSIMLMLKQQKPILPQAADRLDLQLSNTNSAINLLVYELYKLEENDVYLIEK